MEHTSKTNYTTLKTLKDIKSLFPDKLDSLLRHINQSSIPQHRKYYAIERSGLVKPNDYSKVWNSSAA